MAMRKVVQRLTGAAAGGEHVALWRPHSRIQRAWYAESRMLNEEEKAAENIYIKKMEQERMEKLRHESAAREAEGGAKAAADGTPRTAEEAEAVKSKGIALAAGVVAVLTGIYWYATSSSPKKKDEE